MSLFQKKIDAYASYHRDPYNKATHFFGVPLVTMSLFIFFGWFRFIHFNWLTGATLFYLGVAIYYMFLNREVAIPTLAAYLPLLFISHYLSGLPFTESLLWFLGFAGVGWALQLLGHKFEGKKPALVDNIGQIFSAPLFITVEVRELLNKRGA